MRKRSDHLDRKVLYIARRLSLSAEYEEGQHGWFLYRQLREGVEAAYGVLIPENRHSGPVRRLIKSGRIAMKPGRIRNARAFRATDLGDLSLASLMATAEESVDPSVKGTRGRRASVEDDRTVQRISPRQYSRMRTMARAVAFNMYPKYDDETEAWAAVDRPEMFAWDPTAGPGGTGDWRPFLELVEKVAPLPRLRADISAARKLLDLGATKGLLLRTDPTGLDRSLIPAEWAAVEGEWREALSQVVDRTTVSYGMTRLIPAMAEVLPAETDISQLTEAHAKTVIRHLDGAIRADCSLEPWQRWHIRKTCRALMELELIPRIEINAYDRGDTLAAWSRRFCRELGNSVKDAPGDHEVWHTFPYRRLADPENPFALPLAIDYFTLKGTARDSAGFRKLAEFPGVPPRDISLSSHSYWGGRTVESKLDHLSTYFGYLSRYTDLKLSEIDLRQAFTEKHIRGFLRAVKDDSITTEAYACRILHTIGLMSSPHLQHQAILAEDPKTAKRFMAVSALASGKGVAVQSEDASIRFESRSLMHQLQEDYDPSDEVETAKRESALLQAVFDEMLGVDYAYDGMVQIYQAAKKRVLRSVGVEDVGVLLDSRYAERWAREARARLIDFRALSYWNDRLNAPLRRRAVVEEELKHRTYRRGALLLNIPKEHMKVPHSPYRITLVGTDLVGYDLNMWRLYAESGVREALLDGTSCRRVYVNDMRAGSTKGPHLKHGSVSRMMKRVLKLGALELGLDPAGFKEIGKNKFFRHAIASYLVPKNQLSQAVTLLHHTSDRMIRKVYACDDENTTMARARANSRPTAESEQQLQTIVEHFGHDRDLLIQVLGAAGFLPAGETP